MKNCNWCMKLTENKYYCDNCASLCYKECIFCHRPFPLQKYFHYHTERCNSCFTKYKKYLEKKERKYKNEK